MVVDGATVEDGEQWNRDHVHVDYSPDIEARHFAGIARPRPKN